MLEQALLQAGSVGFTHHLFQAVREQTGATRLVIYEYVRGSPATVLAQEGPQLDTVLAEKNRKLAESAFVGPSAYIEEAPEQRQLQVHVLEVVAGGRDDPDSAAGPGAPRFIQTKVALVLRDPDKDPDKHLVISFERDGASGSFTEAQRRFILDRSAAIALAVERHCDALRSPTFPLIASWARYLEKIPGLPVLSSQEALVCAYALLGCTKSDIAERMGISVHSVTAYRRRAYAKLNVTSQIELSSLLIFPRSDAPVTVETEGEKLH